MAHGQKATATLFKLQRSKLSTFVIALQEYLRGVFLFGHLANGFRRSYGNEEEDEIVLQLLCICPALGRRRKRHIQRESKKKK